MTKKIAPGILRFKSILVLIFEKGISKENWANNFRIRKYTFFNISKKDEQKNCSRNFNILKHTFLNISKRDEQNNCAGNFKIRKYAFFFNI